MSSTTAVQHQLRRGTAAQMATFTGVLGEVTYDTSFGRVVTHDGVTAGGYEHMLATYQTSTVASGSTTIGGNTAVMMVLTVPVTLTLPAANAYASGQILAVCDGSGGAGTNNITILTASASDLIYTSTGGTSTQQLISVNGGQALFLTNSSNHWITFSTV